MRRVNLFTSGNDGVPLTPPQEEPVVCRIKTPSLVTDDFRRHPIFLLSSEINSDSTSDAILSPSACSLLSDPDLQEILKKSHSFDNLCESRTLPRSGSDSSCGDVLDDYHPDEIFVRFCFVDVGIVGFLVEQISAFCVCKISILTMMDK